MASDTSTWVGDWHILDNADCIKKSCPAARAGRPCVPIAKFTIAAEGDKLTCTDFSFNALVDPMGGDPFENWAYAGEPFAAAGESPIGLEFTADGGCGVEHVEAWLELGAPSEGRMPVTAQLSFSVEVGFLLESKGYSSWEGANNVWLRRASEASS